MEDFRKIADELGRRQRLESVSPACLAKIVRGGVAFALSFGFPPHPDYRNVSLLLDYARADEFACDYLLDSLGPFENCWPVENDTDAYAAWVWCLLRTPGLPSSRPPASRFA